MASKSSSKSKRAPAAAKPPVKVARKPAKKAAGEETGEDPTWPTLPGMVLEVVKESRLIPGCGFGIAQSIVIGAIDVKLPAEFDAVAIGRFLKAFTLAPVEDLPLVANLGPEGLLVSQMHLWHAAIQRGANLPVFGNCRLWDRGVQPNGARRIGFAVPCHNRPPTMAALKFVCTTVMALAGAGSNAPQVAKQLGKPFTAMRQVMMQHALTGTNSLRFIDAAYRNGIERFPLFGRVWVFGHGVHRMIFNSSLTSSESHLGVGFARDKLTAGGLLRIAGLPVAHGGRAENADHAAKIAAEIGYPVVVKPADLDQGAGVTAGIEDEEDLRQSYAAAAKLSERVIVEKHHFGQDYRVTVLHGKAIKVMVRRAAGVVGDGKHTIAELIELRNREVKQVRAEMLSKRRRLEVDEEAQALLGPRGYAADSVLPDGEFVPLRRKGNVSAGGTFEVPPIEALHPDNRMLAESAAATIGLQIAGIDIISGDIGKSWRETGGIIVEVNASPQIGYTGSEEIYGDILTAELGGKGRIPVHLLLLQDGIEAPSNLPEFAKSADCNAAAWGTNGWVDAAGMLGPFADTFRASKAVLFDPRTRGALIAMSEKDALKCGLPAVRFASIRLVGKDGWQPSSMLEGMLQGHSKKIVRQRFPAKTAGALA